MKPSLVVIFILFLFTGVSAQQIKYGIANDSWNPDSLGNHRAVLTVGGAGNVAKATIEWRRRDTHPELKDIWVVDAKTNSKIANVKALNINREQGTVYFEPTSGPGTYYLYYMPYQVEGRSNYPNAEYRKATVSQWPKSTVNAIPAKLVRIEAINAMSSFYPMEVIATAAETKALIKQHPQKDYFVFTEDRLNPIKMQNDLPQQWITKGLKNNFSGTASKGENYTYQLGIYPVKKDLSDVKVVFSDLKSKTGKAISAKAFSCLNTDGVNWDGSPLHKTVNVAKNKVQALWILADIPKDINAGTYTGTVTTTTKGSASTTIQISLTVNNTVLADGGINEPQKQTRLKWLNSTMAEKNEVIAPYIPLVIKDKTIALLGRQFTINQDGLPAQIQTFFTPEMTELSATPKNILVEPVHFHVTRSNHKDIKFNTPEIAFTDKQAGIAKWTAKSTSDSLNMEVNAALEFDGFVSYTVKFIAVNDIKLDNISLHFPFSPQAAKYMMGLGQKGGYRPDSLNWKWDVANKNQDGAWIGDVNAGVQYSLRDNHYVRPLNTNFYLQKPLLLPTSWGNYGKGGIKIAKKGQSILADNYSGERLMKKGDTLYYNFTLLITPFHPINTDFQWSNRFYHKYNNLDTIKATGATLINIHHATPINPFINYPFIAHKEMKSYIDEAHSKGLKVKIYNTVRELSNSAYETFPLRSLGHEIYSPGKGGGYSWLQEHLGDDYIAAWYVPEIKDAAVVNSGMSRWHNYYVEGMNWLVNNVGIDGLYLDDVAFDRTTMKRVKSVLTQNGHPGIIDLHSANQYNKSDGFNNSANLYMEHFPYLNRLWFGEYFDYEKSSPDFFLTESSGIPFGLMGEMLQDGGNAWRGMVYGMTNRMPWSDGADPRAIWKAWDDFGMQGTKMIGYWVENNPVKTNNPDVIATIYKKDNSVLIALASWAKEDTKIKLNIDWKALGIDPAKATITAPEVKNFQPTRTFSATDEILVTKNKGWIIVVKQN
ncbi:glycoside hydrolase domain-containing protein [Pedobacter sp. B4-66]|uniref:glycoside hydrolase domain-containing protein n=1 Tax=Pedobacter sp. B4-66 TaxID=2817280 RepID=UPI002023C995|nr:glycoside hydrolase domain-containing protein [Pedobacter sp. B4-66]